MVATKLINLIEDVWLAKPVPARYHNARAVGDNKEIVDIYFGRMDEVDCGELTGNAASGLNDLEHSAIPYNLGSNLRCFTLAFERQEHLWGFNFGSVLDTIDFVLDDESSREELGGRALRAISLFLLYVISERADLAGAELQLPEISMRCRTFAILGTGENILNRADFADAARAKVDANWPVCLARPSTDGPDALIRSEEFSHLLSLDATIQAAERQNADRFFTNCAQVAEKNVSLKGRFLTNGQRQTLLAVLTFQIYFSPLSPEQLARAKLALYWLFLNQKP